MASAATHRQIAVSQVGFGTDFLHLILKLLSSWRLRIKLRRGFNKFSSFSVAALSENFVGTPIRPFPMARSAFSKRDWYRNNIVFVKLQVKHFCGTKAKAYSFVKTRS